MVGQSGRTSPTVAVLKGGLSSEREVSLSSGAACAEALRGEGYNVIEVDAGRDLPFVLRDLSPDVVFNALHGKWGEDGLVQGVLEWLEIPYTHSGVRASALAMDKALSKQVYAQLGLPIVPSVIVSKSDAMHSHVLRPPYVIKPNSEGSSVGIYLIDAAQESPPELGSDMPDYVMVEAFAPGRELTTSVMGERALGVTEIVTEGWYDYDAKYSVGGSKHIVPAKIPDEISALCEDYALKAHRGLGCRGVSRTDFRWDDTCGADGLVLLETNTQPGMTSTSLTPEQASAAGISMGALCRWMVEDASCLR